MTRIGAAFLALALGACASSSHVAPSAADEAFETYWSERFPGDEYARVGVRSSTFRPSVHWTIVRFVIAPSSNGAIVAHRTQLTSEGLEASTASSETCPGVASAVEELGALPLPAMRQLELDRAFVISSNAADVRLRVNTFFDADADGDAVSLVSVELRTISGVSDPLVTWYGRLRESSEQCWTKLMIDAREETQ